MNRTRCVPTLFLFLSCFFSSPSFAAPDAQWIWSSATEAAPKNRFTYFRKVVELKTVPADAALRLAADSNARVWINGQVVRRKVARYFEDRITAEVIDAAPYLKPGKNVVVALHHNWGDIRVFQRSANRHAGIRMEASWIRSDGSWKCITAPEFLAHEKQVVGVIGDARIRYPVIMDGGKRFSGDVNDPAFDDSAWKAATVVSNGPWPARPTDVETPGQREYPVRPFSVLAAGISVPGGGFRNEPFSMAADMKGARLTPDADAAKRAEDLLRGLPVTIEGKAGTAQYITFDFGRPVHGYPFLEIAEATPGAAVDFGYGEIPLSIREGKAHVRPDGWIDTEGVVGPGYGDRYITASGAQTVELPDERTARWMAVHVRFPRDGRVVLRDIGIVKSQYPVRMMGSFSCGDERVEQAVKLCLIHAEVTMCDSYVDTPGREDGQWIEDARPRAEIGARWFGDIKLRRFLIRTFAQSQGADGDFHPFPPSSFPAYPAPYDWSVQWVAALYDDYRWTGKTDLVKEYWTTLEKYWANVLARTGPDGVWRTARVLADLRVGLHCQNDSQSSGIVTPWIIERLRWSAEMADAIGENERAAAWRKTADLMAGAFRKHHIVPAKGTVPAHVGDRLDTANPALERGYSQAGQTVALTAGLLSPEEARADLEYAFGSPDGAPAPGVTRWNNPTYFNRSLTVLSRYGMGERAAKHFQERMSPYLPGHPNNTVPTVLQGPYGGPLPEYWVSREDLNLKDGEINEAQPGDPTGSHGWGASPLLWLHESVLGVTVAQPGGGVIRIAPDASGLPYVSGHTVTPKGMVWVQWDPSAKLLEVEIPAGVEAEVLVPRDREGKRMVVNYAEGKATPFGSGRYAYKISGEGKYTFRVW